MARIRTIKPEFPHSESMGRVSRDARLLFIMLWTLVDDAGITRGNSRMLASLLFPYDDDAGKLISDWMLELDREGCIVQYVVDGQTYVQITNWLNHQKIDKPSQSKFPEFANIREDSRILPVGGEGIGGEGIGGEGIKPSATSAEKKTPKPKTISPVDILLSLGVAEQAAKDWLTVRKAKRAPLTETALDELRLEAGKAGITIGQAVAICAKKSWQGFNANWNWKNDHPSKGYSGVQEARLDCARQIMGGIGNGANRSIIDISSGNADQGHRARIPEVIDGVWQSDEREMAGD